jgi:hypothetical protein
LKEKLRNIKLIDEQKINNETYKLVTMVQDLSIEDEQKALWGTFVFENLETLPQIDGTVKYSPVAQKFKFAFILKQSFIYFIPFASRYDAETIAVKVNKILFGKKPIILKHSLSSQAITRFLRSNPYILKRCTWKDLDIPGIDKASLGGPDVERPSDYKRYEMHGVKKFIIIELRENGWVIGLSDIGTIIFYSKVDVKDILKFLEERILPLIS